MYSSFVGVKNVWSVLSILGLKIMEIKVNDTEITLLTPMGRRVLLYLPKRVCVVEQGVVSGS